VGISGCDILLGPNTPLGKGTLSIGFGDGGGGRSARSLIDDETLAALRYELVLSGPDNQTINVSLTAGKTFKEQVSLGEWRIEAKAYNDDNVLFGKGMTTVRVRAGANEAEVPMTVVVPEDTLVNDLDLTSRVTAPVNGETPDTTPIDTEEYTGSITWEEEGGTPFNGNSFAEATVYQVVVRLEAKSGYTFDGLAADSFRHDAPGVRVTNEAGSGNAITVRIVFPATGAATPTEYTVTFRLNDGTETVHATKTVTAPATTVTDFPGNPSRTDCGFAGWNTAANGLGTGFTAATTVSDDITVYAKWTEIPHGSYTVTFNSDGGTTEASPATKTVASPNTSIDALPTVQPTKTGYTFGGWYTAQNGGGSEFTATSTVSASITVYAKWNSYTYTVTFNSDSGTTEASPATKTVVSPNTSIDALPTVQPTKTRYTIGGWYTAQNAGGSVFTATGSLSACITVYAQWKGDTYTVTFNSDSGTTEASPATKTVTSPNTTIDALPTVQPTKTGYTFGGWYTAQNGGGSEFTATSTVSASITVYAKWTEIPPGSYTVTFNSDGGNTEASPTTKTVVSPNTTIDALPAVQPTKTGYTFGGWYTQANGGGIKFTATSTVSASMTVYAQWTGETYTVAFKSNYGTNDTLYTKEVTIPATDIGVANFPGNPLRTDYGFAGWNTDPGGGGSAFTATSTVSDNMTVYAQWTPTYTITLDLDAGDGAFSQGTFTVSKGTGVDPTSQTISITNSAGYTNPRWFVDGDLKGTETNIIIQAADYSLGNHSLTLLISKSGVSWSKEITFTVTN
jgi:uncharacterized repeat protein (TIGR02543 family)